ncbi:14214_t:CDS:2 [Entrophospora sp. SA101]|nr:14214_t:CDS:2 [Entrophospora sp. SA101]CAJ0898802.1 7228_t:CDS:2 [Entrophospora sp. SA101]
MDGVRWNIYQDNDKYGLYESEKETKFNESDILYEVPEENKDTSSNKPLTTQRKRYKSNKEIEEFEALSNDSFELFTIVGILNNPSTLSNWSKYNSNSSLPKQLKSYKINLVMKIIDVLSGTRLSNNLNGLVSEIHLKDISIRLHLSTDPNSTIELL